MFCPVMFLCLSCMRRCVCVFLSAHDMGSAIPIYPSCLAVQYVRSNRHYMLLFSIFFALILLRSLSSPSAHNTNLTIGLFSFYYYHFNVFDPNAVVYALITPIHSNNCVCECAQICTWLVWWAISLDDRHYRTLWHTHNVLLFASNSLALPFCFFCLFLFFVSTLQCFFRFSVHFHRMIFSIECIFFPYTSIVCVCSLFVSTQMWIMRNSIYLTTYWECHRHYSLMAIPYYECSCSMCAFSLLSATEHTNACTRFFP